MKKIYVFSRIILKKGPINKYGQMGFRYHKEVIFVKAPNQENALFQIAPYNYKKHIRFVLEDVHDENYNDNNIIVFNEILDLGEVQVLESGRFKEITIKDFESK